MRLLALTIVHVIASIALSVAASAYSHMVVWLAVGFFGLVIAQGLLVSIWAGLTSVPKAARCAGACLTVAYLWALVLTAAKAWQRADREEWVVIAIVIAASLLSVIGAFLVVRRWGPTIVVCNVGKLTSGHRPFQFNMRHLFIPSLVVAVVLAIGRAVREIDQSFERRWFFLTVMCAVMGVCLVQMVLAATWAGLGSARVVPRTTVALLLSLIVGFIPSYYFRAPTLREYLLFPTMFGVAQAITIVSLLVARTAGYRIVSRKPTDHLLPVEIAWPIAHPLD
jgi:hypothetical protein